MFERANQQTTLFTGAANQQDEAMIDQRRKSSPLRLSPLGIDSVRESRRIRDSKTNDGIRELRTRQGNAFLSAESGSTLSAWDQVKSVGRSILSPARGLRAFDRSSLGTRDLDGDFCSRKYCLEGFVCERVPTITELAEVTQCASAVDHSGCRRRFDAENVGR